MAISLICAKKTGPTSIFLAYSWPTLSKKHDAAPAYIACCYYSWDWNL